MPQNAPKFNDANDLEDFSGGSPELIFYFLALDELAARILWHRFLGIESRPANWSQARLRKFCTKWENSLLDP
jgi:hypothetical protein